jgi:UDP-galactopyranose mutase
MYDYLIVGAGLFGSVCAYELNKKGYKVLVIDKRNHVGGNIYTEEIEDERIEGVQVHKYGAHIFHTSNENTWKYINKFGEFNNFINSPIAIYKNKVYNLPFNMNTFNKIWNTITPEQTRIKIEQEKKKSHIDNPSNLEEQAISLVGKTIYKRLIKGYTEKQWGKSCKELSPDIIKRLPVRYTYNNNYFNDIYQGIPKEGYTKIIENMLEGIEVYLCCDYFEHKDEYDKMAKKIIYTGPIDRYYEYCYGELEYRSLRFEDEILDINNYQGNAVVNYTDKKIPYTRIIEHKHFNYIETDGTIITKEYPQKWNKLREPYYPINNKKNNELYNKYNELSKKDNKIIFGGRLGLYQYLDMDKTIEKALECVEKEVRR